jgi:hypothetical protein
MRSTLRLPIAGAAALALSVVVADSAAAYDIGTGDQACSSGGHVRTKGDSDMGTQTHRHGTSKKVFPYKAYRHADYWVGPYVITSWRVEVNSFFYAAPSSSCLYG